MSLLSSKTSREFYNPTGIVSAGNFDVPQDILVYTFCYDYYLSRWRLCHELESSDALHSKLSIVSC